MFLHRVEGLVDASTWWWLLGGGLVALELMSGTFLLLMLASGAAAGALAAHAGWPLNIQITLAGVVGALAACIWYWRQKRQTTSQPLGTQASPDVSLDMGHTVHVTQWQADGTAQVQYRGTWWSARFQPRAADEALAPGPHRICAMQGNQLVLEKI